MTHRTCARLPAGSTTPGMRVILFALAALRARTRRRLTDFAVARRSQSRRLRRNATTAPAACWSSPRTSLLFLHTSIQDNTISRSSTIHIITFRRNRLRPLPQKKFRPAPENNINTVQRSRTYTSSVTW